MWTYERSMDYYLITSLFFCQPLFKEQKQNSSGFFAVRHKRKQLTNRLPRCIITKHLRECWNGRQARLRCVWLRRVGSSPISRTRKSPEPMARGFFWCEGRTRKGGRAKRGKKVSGGHFFSPWESPRKSNDGSQRTGRRFPAIGTSSNRSISLHSKATSRPKGTSYCDSNTSFATVPGPQRASPLSGDRLFR